jgi:hypothetical protein
MACKRRFPQQREAAFFVVEKKRRIFTGFDSKSASRPGNPCEGGLARLLNLLDQQSANHRLIAVPVARQTGLTGIHNRTPGTAERGSAAGCSFCSGGLADGLH